jgi:type VI secretion system protein ImpG
MDHFESFQQELQFLRNSVEDFGRAYPAAASELKLSAGRSSDPHVEQLLQSFAFLSGKLRSDMELQRGEIPNQMLHSLYPNLIRSQPCMTILQANVDSDGANFVSGSMLAKNSLFSAKPKLAGEEKKYDCMMQCCYDTPLWPLKVDSIKVMPKNYHSIIDQHAETQAVLSVKVSGYGMDSIYEYPLKRIRFYLSASMQRHFIYRMLKDKLSGIAIKVNGDVRMLEHAKLKWLGFESEHNVLPDDDGSQRAYRMLQEYFTFPDKFYFFELEGFENTGCLKEFELLFMINEASSKISVTNTSLMLNCFPAINLYPKTFKPLQLQQTSHEYPLVVDDNPYLSAEVHSITQMSSIAYDGRVKIVEPWLGLHADSGSEQYYISRLQPQAKPESSGCDMIISLYDAKFSVRDPVDQTLVVKGICNNRRLPESFRIGNTLKPVGMSPMSDATVVEQPTRFKGANLNTGNNVRLLSQLTLNQLSLGAGKDGLTLLKQILTLYADPDSLSQLNQINALHEWKAESKVKRMGKAAWRGHYQGTLLTITVDEYQTDNSNPLLLAEVLSHFFGLFTTLNHFVQLQLVSRQREGVWKKWPPRIGEQVLL